MGAVPKGWAERVAAATKTVKATETKKSAPKRATKKQEK
jgi:hypothetical protein